MLDIGSIVDGKYRILAKVGQGGMSVVYLALNEKANKQWAIKEARKDGVKDYELVKQSLAAETDILKNLSHPNLPSIVDVIDTRDSFIIIMDYVEGKSLKDTLDEYGAQSEENVVEWAKQLCDVLGYLHSRKPAIIHRDLKPANIMLKPDGNITVLDFGTAREYKERNLADTTCLGTIGYAAPEQFGGMGQTDERTDIYCLGATLYHLITGKNPCEEPYAERRIREVNPALSEGLENIILKCTRAKPAERYQSAAELMFALENYTDYDVKGRRKKISKLFWFGASIAMTVLFSCTAFWAYKSGEQLRFDKYEERLNTAQSVEHYYEAILTDPSRTDAYEQLNQYLTNDYSLSKSEGAQLLQLLVGLDKQNDDGYSSSVDVLSELQAADPEGYADVCFNIGWSMLSYYNTNTDRDRYEAAAKWFSLMRDSRTENANIASIFCDISACTTKINMLRGSMMIQTQELKVQRENLWKMLQELKTKAADYDVDYRIQVWIEIVKLINGNVSDFLGIVKAEDIAAFLMEVESEVAVLNDVGPETEVLLQELHDSISAALARVETANG